MWVESEYHKKSDFEDYSLKNNTITYLISSKMLEKVKILSLNGTRTIIKYFSLKDNSEVKTTQLIGNYDREKRPGRVGLLKERSLLQF